LSEAVAKLASITFSRLSLLSWTRNLGFLTEGKSCCYIRHTFLLGFPTGWSSTTHHRSRLPRMPVFVPYNATSLTWFADQS
jgi:hypothetical protein